VGYSSSPAACSLKAARRGDAQMPSRQSLGSRCFLGHSPGGCAKVPGIVARPFVSLRIGVKVGGRIDQPGGRNAPLNRASVLKSTPGRSRRVIRDNGVIGRWKHSVRIQRDDRAVQTADVVRDDVVREGDQSKGPESGCHGNVVASVPFNCLKAQTTAANARARLP